MTTYEMLQLALTILGPGLVVAWFFFKRCLKGIDAQIAALGVMQTTSQESYRLLQQDFGVIMRDLVEIRERIARMEGHHEAR